MARRRNTPEQLVAILRKAERAGDRQEPFKKHGISEQTFHRWRKMYGGMGVSEIRRIKELEEGNRKLKEVSGRQALVIEAMKEYPKKREWL